MSGLLSASRLSLSSVHKIPVSVHAGSVRSSVFNEPSHTSIPARAEEAIGACRSLFTANEINPDLWVVTVPAASLPAKGTGSRAHARPVCLPMPGP